MATNVSTVENRTADIAPTYQLLGTDRESYHHVLDRNRDAVHRIDLLTGERERVTDLRSEEFPARGNAVETYVHDFVAAQVGWVERSLTNRDIFGEA